MVIISFNSRGLYRRWSPVDETVPVTPSFEVNYENKLFSRAEIIKAEFL